MIAAGSATARGAPPGALAGPRPVPRATGRGTAPGAGDPPPGRVGAEFVGRARVLRSRIALAQDAEARAIDAILRPLRPRPGWPTPERPNWLKLLARRYRGEIESPCRIGVASRIEPDGRFVLDELRIRATRIVREGWCDGDEPALSVEMMAVATKPYAIAVSLLADVGLHALARRFERGRPNDDGAVLLDLAPLGYRWAATVKSAGPGGEFQIEAPASGGRWRGAVTLVAGRELPVLLVRTFVEA
jgi:hypothetical protein